MDDSRTTSLEQLRALVAANGVVRFAGQRRDEVYGWMERTLVRHEYAGLPRPDKGVVRLYLTQMTGLSRAQVTRLITGYQQTGRVTAVSYQRIRFPTIYTAADVDLLAYVDRAPRQPEWDRPPGASWSGSTASMARLPTSGWRGSRWRTCTGCVPRRRTGSATSATSQRGLRRSPSASGASRDRRARPDTCASDTVHQGDQDGCKGLYHINAVDEVTQWEIVVATPQISELWLLPVLEAILQQFPFVIHGFHSDNGSEFINYTVARLLENYSSNRPGRGRTVPATTAWSSPRTAPSFAAHRLRLHRRATRRGDGSVPPGVPQPVPQLPSALRCAHDPHPGQRQAPQDLPALGHALGVVPELPGCERFLRPGVTLAELESFAQLQSDTEAALAMQRAKRKLLGSVKRTQTA